jgi:hypothetical protein
VWDVLEGDLIFIVRELRSSLKWTSHNYHKLRGCKSPSLRTSKLINPLPRSSKASETHSVNHTVSEARDPTVRWPSLNGAGILTLGFGYGAVGGVKSFTLNVLRGTVRTVNTKPYSSFSAVIS